MSTTNGNANRTRVLEQMLEFKRTEYTARDLARNCALSHVQVSPILSAARGMKMVVRKPQAGIKEGLWHNTPNLLALSLAEADKRLAAYDPSGQGSVLRERIREDRETLVNLITETKETFSIQQLAGALMWSRAKVEDLTRPLRERGLLQRLIGSEGLYRKDPVWSKERALRTYPSLKRIKKPPAGRSKPRRRTKPVGASAILEYDVAVRPAILTYDATVSPVAPEPSTPPTSLSLDRLAEWKAKAEKYDRLAAKLQALGIDPGE